MDCGRTGRRRRRHRGVVVAGADPPRRTLELPRLQRPARHHRYAPARPCRRVRRAGGVDAHAGPAGVRRAPVHARLHAAPLTLPSHASLLTAVSPPRHGVRANGLFRLGPSLPTLATMLQAGRLSDGRVRRRVRPRRPLRPRPGLRPLRRSVRREARRRRHRRRRTPRRGRRQTRRRLDLQSASNLRSSPQSNPPWFAWVHLYDPHEPYRAPEPYASQHAAYDAEVAYTDAMVGRLLADIGPAALEQTLVVVAADHGESLGEHGERSHGVFAYDVTMRVPLIVWAGRRLGGQSWDGLTRLIDVTPTILDLVGVAAPSGLEGRSLVAAMASRDTAAPPAYFEAMDANLTRNWAPLTGVVSGHDKLIDLPIAELYDRRRGSAGVVEPVHRAGRPRAYAPIAASDRHVAFARDGASSERTALSADARQRLQSLGYIASAAAPGTRVYSDKDDPKTADRTGQRTEPEPWHCSRAARCPKRSSRSARSSERTPTSRPRTACSRRCNATPATCRKRSKRSTRSCAAASPIRACWSCSPATCRRAVRSRDRPKLLEAVVAAHPDYADAFNSLGVAYSRMRERERARAAFQKVLELDPTSATAYENLGVDALMAGDVGTAVQMLTRALELDPALAAAHNALATALLRQGRRAEALEHWRTAVRARTRACTTLSTTSARCSTRTGSRPRRGRSSSGSSARRRRRATRPTSHTFAACWIDDSAGNGLGPRRAADARRVRADGAAANPNAQLRSGALARSNLLLVTIDTLRTDRVGAYSGGPLTPAIDRLAARGVRFTNAHAHAPMTLPAHTSIFTGLTPPSHGVRNNGSTALSTRTPTLATLLHDAGYRTGAFVGAFVLDARFGLARGFDAYDDAVGSDTGPVTFAFAERTADRVTQLAGDWITSTPAAREPAVVRVDPSVRSTRAVSCGRAAGCQPVRQRGRLRGRRARPPLRSAARGAAARLHARRRRRRPRRVAGRTRRRDARALRLRGDASHPVDRGRAFDRSERVGRIGRADGRPPDLGRLAGRRGAFRRRPLAPSSHPRRAVAVAAGVLRSARRQPHAELGAADRRDARRLEIYRPSRRGAVRLGRGSRRAAQRHPRTTRTARRR